MYITGAMAFKSKEIKQQQLIINYLSFGRKNRYKNKMRSINKISNFISIMTKILKVICWRKIFTD
jgi:hypothetical protein